jgi:hypothetical protein
MQFQPTVDNFLRRWMANLQFPADTMSGFLWAALKSITNAVNWASIYWRPAFHLPVSFKLYQQLLAGLSSIWMSSVFLVATPFRPLILLPSARLIMSFSFLQLCSFSSVTIGHTITWAVISSNTNRLSTSLVLVFQECLWWSEDFMATLYLFTKRQHHGVSFTNKLLTLA